MPQFRVEFMQDPATGLYLAELYDPEDTEALLVRTEASYPSQAAALMAMIDLFKKALAAPARAKRGKRKNAVRKGKKAAAPRKKAPARKTKTAKKRAVPRRR